MSDARPMPTYLVERFRNWRTNRFEPDRVWYSRLAEDGQRPRAMVIACCDSRVDVNAMFAAEPGDLFIVRNVANLAPPYQPDHMHHGTSAAIEYAVNFLRVAHIIVLGHAQCGGVAACREFCSGAASEALATSTFLRSWTDIVAPAYQRALASIEAAPEAERAARLQAAMEREGVRESLANLATFPFVRDAVAAERLTLHGAWLDIASGQLHATGAANGAFEVV